MAQDTFATIDHVQLCIPAGGNDTERHFFVDVLGMREIPRTSNLDGTEGGWYVSGSVGIHVMRDPEFTAAKRAHPALRVNDFEGLLARLEAAGVPFDRETLPSGERRAFTRDPFGNRLELIPIENTIYN